MSDLAEDAPQPAPAGSRPGLLARVFFVLGAAGLLTAMASDAIAVIGRHIGRPFLGSIELVQACVVVASSSAMIGATLTGSHATVHIVLERLPPRARAGLETYAALMGAICFAGLCAGSAWIASDLWAGGERTELLGLPIVPLRLFWCASAAIVCALFLKRAAAALAKAIGR